jgi:hypothetical protein
VKSKSVAKRCYLDASALAKRYVVEQGTVVVNHLFRRVTCDHMMCLTLGIDAANFAKIPATDSLVNATASLGEKHSLNATGVLTFTPETQTEGDLDALLGSVHEFQT